MGSSDMSCKLTVDPFNLFYLFILAPNGGLGILSNLSFMWYSRKGKQGKIKGSTYNLVPPSLRHSCIKGENEREKKAAVSVINSEDIVGVLISSFFQHSLCIVQIKDYS